MNKLFITLVIVLGSYISTSVVANGKNLNLIETPAPSGVSVGDKAPAFSLKNIDGPMTRPCNPGTVLKP